MITINCIKSDAGIQPETPIPADAVRVTCDGEKYTVYQPGDELPPEPVYDGGE